jgi:hypothetical protein
MRSQLYAAGALVGVCLLASPVSTTAAPLAGAMSKDLLTQNDGNSLVIQVQRRHRGHYHRGRGGDAAGAAAAGAAFGLFLGAIIASEAQRQQAIEYCSQRYRSFDPASMTYMGRDGFRHPCP